MSRQHRQYRLPATPRATYRLTRREAMATADLLQAEAHRLLMLSACRGLTGPESERLVAIRRMQSTRAQ